MRIQKFVVLVALGVLTAGCYSLEPAAGVTPEPGTRLAFDINDVGRVALGGSMGPEIDQIEGRLLAKESNEYLIAVMNVRLLKGGEQVWHGEQVRLKPEYINTTYLRKYSAGRTIALSAVAVAAVVAIAGKTLLTNNSVDPKGADTLNNGGISRRIPPRPRKVPPRILFHPLPPTTP